MEGFPHTRQQALALQVVGICAKHTGELVWWKSKLEALEGVSFKVLFHIVLVVLIMFFVKWCLGLDFLNSGEN